MSTSDKLEFVTVAVPRPLDHFYTYQVNPENNQEIRRGSWVQVPFGRGKTHAFVVAGPLAWEEVSEKIEGIQIKKILEVGTEETCIPTEIFDLCQWAHLYYQAPLGEVLNCAVPAAALGLRSNAKKPRPIEMKTFEPLGHALTQFQLDAVSLLEEARQKCLKDKVGRVTLLHGITGSGKTEVYLEIARKVLDEGKSILILVPEIALTPQLHERFEKGLGQTVGVWHSALPDGKRRDYWAALKEGKLKAVIGARSSVFSPLLNLGLIVVDEEHDPSYKQEDRFRYHARDLAIVRAQKAGALVILGSATPSLETRERVREGRYGVATLKERVTAGGLPDIDLVDLTKEEVQEGIQTLLAKRTVQEIQRVITEGKQVMIFLNRRGFAHFLICQDCGFTPECINCSVTLTMYQRTRNLRCHICGHKEPIEDRCPTCTGDNLKPIGFGTESLETDLSKLIKGFEPLRLDRDAVTSATRLEIVINDFRSGKGNALLGTQMLVKGHDFPQVKLVVVVFADALFRWPDFRAPERALQVLTQVSGRAGRGEERGKVLIQTYAVDHPVFQILKKELSEDEFLEGELDLRRELGYPPFGRIARIRLESPQQREAMVRSQQVAHALSHSGVEILGPSEAFMERVKNIYRWDFLLKSRDITQLQKAILMARDFCRQRKWALIIDMDPVGVG
jgi:primosomal protein N' (replication factor Y) (superfamily II helicase)